MNWQICHATVLYGFFNAMSSILWYVFSVVYRDLVFYDIYKRHSDVENTLYSTWRSKISYREIL